MNLERLFHEAVEEEITEDKIKYFRFFDEKPTEKNPLVIARYTCLAKNKEEAETILKEQLKKENKLDEFELYYCNAYTQNEE